MERPAKRPRVGSFLHDDEDADDELFLDPNEVNAQRDPAVLLEQSRAVASFKLKSRWENVFEKYEKDFTGADDIINFYTEELPEVEVDNGHLRSLADADDAKSVAASESAELDEEERILHGNGAGGGQLIRSGPSSLMPLPRPLYGGRMSGLASLAPAPPRLSTMFSSGLNFPSFSSFRPLKTFSEPLESIWNAPELPAEAFNNHVIATTAPRRRVAVKALLAAEDDGSDDDDIIMGNSSSWMRDRGNETIQSAPPRVTTKESSPAVENVLPRDDTPEPAPTTDLTSDAQEVVKQPERRKHGRSRKLPKVKTSAKKAVSTRPGEATEVPDSDTELLESSPAVATDIDGLKDLSNDTSSAELSFKPAKSLVRIEVQLLRRRRPDIVPAQAIPRISLLGSSPAGEREQPLHDSSALVVRAKTSVQKRRRTLPPPSIPAPRKVQRHDRRRQTLPATQTVVQLTTPANSSPVKPHGEDEMVLESQDQPVSEVSEQVQPAAEPATKPAAPTEHFSRNAIDKDYDLSDEDESLVPLSRARKSTKQSKKPSSTAKRALAKRVPKTSTLLESSPSIRVAFPAVKKSFRSTRTKAPEEAPAEEPEPTETTPEKVSTPIAQSTTELEDSVAKIIEHPEQPSTRADDALSSPLLDPSLNRVQTENSLITPSSNQSQGKPVPSPAALVTPSSRHSKSKPAASPGASRPSTSKRSILSLLSDSDEDELSLSLDQISPLVRKVHNQHSALPIRSRSTAKKPSVNRMSLASYARATPTKKRSRLSGGWTSASTVRILASEASVGNTASKRSIIKMPDNKADRLESNKYNVHPSHLTVAHGNSIAYSLLRNNKTRLLQIHTTYYSRIPLFSNMLVSIKASSNCIRLNILNY
ncbi:hypothetical protein CONLIGDRAFT_649409 [Coniochaeta ligniaria NRRL 30616]|uniref:Uncharacterized protein n=1 Tax=Coniochaeta ligniaria NRRL 30616 TaxID=1408157 RepID=A0A1J7I9V8_9PEZI|nr:hypothetical protein CONLIGDRAFT_649409 [Coniochaeta ligniaria NRRL 30616]